MTAKCSLFVDAGYLLASSASRLTGTSLRSGIHVKYRRLVQGLIKAAEETTGLPVLRVHWYDSAKDGVPDRSQERIGELPKVKLRLGRFGYDGQQKGVDLRLGLDMVAHAHHKAAEVFLLVSGDDDLTEAVEDVQVHGVSVVVLAVPSADGQPHGVSRHLVRAADEIITLDPHIIDEAIIPIETPEQAKDDSTEAPHGSDILLLKPQVEASDLAQLADAIVFGNTELAGADELHPHLVLGEQLESSVSAEAGLDGEVIDLSDLELLLNAAHLDLPDASSDLPVASGFSELPLEQQADSVTDIVPHMPDVEATSTHEPARHTVPEPLTEDAAEAAHIAEADGGILLGEPAATPDHTGHTGHTGAETDSAPETLAPEPGNAGVKDSNQPPLIEASVVTQTLSKLMKPTPRSVASNIGKPVERPLRPTYSTGPDNPKQGTWATQWTEVIDSVVGRVLNSLTKSTTADHWNVISLGRPSIPQEIDKALLLDATEAMGVYTLSDAERHEVRAAFWKEFDNVNR